MERKNRPWNDSGEASETEFTDMVIIDGEIYIENEITTEVVDELPEVIDEDWLYEAYRDEKFDRQKRGK